jgi:hypothetical protein
MEKNYAGEGLSAGRAIGGPRPVDETATSTIEQTLKLAGELAFRANRLEARLFGERAEAGSPGGPSPDGVVNQLVAQARSTSDALNDGIRALNRIAQQMGSE